jgi:hypothetical protein
MKGQRRGSALAILLVLVVLVYIQRRPLADQFVRNELERRGVTATYELERVGFRSQVVRNLVIGNPAKPDLTARYAELQTRLTWNGSFERRTDSPSRLSFRASGSTRYSPKERVFLMGSSITFTKRALPAFFRVFSGLVQDSKTRFRVGWPGYRGSVSGSAATPR